jgi:membrane-bound serine protease (ClpP class)
VGVAQTAIDSKGGKVFVEGELWDAHSEQPIGKGDEVEIIGMQGMRLRVKRQERGVSP